MFVKTKKTSNLDYARRANIFSLILGKWTSDRYYRPIGEVLSSSSRSFQNRAQCIHITQAFSHKHDTLESAVEDDQVCGIVQESACVRELKLGWLTRSG